MAQLCHLDNIFFRNGERTSLCCLQLSIDFRHKFVGKILFREINDVVKHESRVADTIAHTIHGQTKSAPHLLQLARLRTTGSQFADGKHVRIVPPFLQSPFREQKTQHIRFALGMSKAQQLLLAMKYRLYLVGDVLVGIIVVLREVACARGVQIVKGRLEVGGIFRSILPCKLFPQSASQYIQELSPQPSVVLPFWATKALDAVYEEQSQRLDRQALAAKILTFRLKVAHQG